MTLFRVWVASQLTACAVLTSACVSAPGMPAAIADELRSREILTFEEQLLEGVPTLVLAYRTQEALIEAWPTVAKEVAGVLPHLQGEADRLELRGLRIVARSPDDACAFDYRRSGDDGWEEVGRDVLEVRRLPSGRSIALRSIEGNSNTDGQGLAISYLTTLDLSEQRADVREEAQSVLEAYADKAESAGAEKALVSPSNRLHDGVTIGLVFVREEANGAWTPTF